MRRALLTLVLAGAAAGAVAQELRPVSPSDPERLRSVRDPRISPDGEWVAYVVRTSDLEKDRDGSDIWMVSWDGAQTLQLTHTEKESEGAPRWSPDGRYLSFLVSRGDEDAKSQVWLLDRRGGEARQLTEMEGGVEAYEWSPDSKRLALIAADPDPDEREQKAEKGDEPKTAKPIVIDRYQFKQDRIGYLRHLRSHLYLFDLEKRNAELLTPGDFDDSSPSWAPDGRDIAFVSKRGDDPDRHDNSDIFLIEARAGAEARQLTRHEGADGSFGSAPAWSPDGTWIAYLRGGPPRWSFYDGPDLAIISAAGGEPRIITEGLDRDVYRPAWTADGGALLMLLEDDRNQYLARVSVGGGNVERLSVPGSVVNRFDSGAAGRIALLMTTPEEPAEIFAFERGATRPLSSQNEEPLRGIALGSVSGIEFESADGTKVHGIVTKPPGFEAGRRYPTVALIHGGPTAQNGFEFDPGAQVLAGAGYLVVRPNYRGSPGRGREFSRAIFADWGNLEVQDVLAAIDHVVEAGLADPERLGIGGWSYGGMTTNYTIAKDTRFKAAVSGASIANVLTGYGTDQYIRQYENELGKPWEEIDKYFAVSQPFLHADKIETPTLFLCGEKDFNVPLINSEQMYQALRSLGIETQLVIYPGRYHGLGKPSYRKDRHERYIGWFDRFLKDAE